MQLFVMFLFYFFMEYSKNILQVKPHPKECTEKGLTIDKNAIKRHVETEV